MTKDTFKGGMVILTATFPGQVFNMGTYWDLLSDLEDVDFVMAIKAISKEMKEIFPSTNLVAVIRGHAAENKRARSSKQKKIEDRRCDPPGPEWEALKTKLGLTSFH